MAGSGIHELPGNPRAPKSDHQIHRIMSNTFSKVLRHVQNMVKKETPVVTGHLRDSWTWEVLLDTLERYEGVVGTNTGYARPVEFGVQPHFRTIHDRYGMPTDKTYIHPGFEGRFMMAKGTTKAERGAERLIRIGVFDALTWI